MLKMSFIRKLRKLRLTLLNCNIYIALTLTLLGFLTSLLIAPLSIAAVLTIVSNFLIILADFIVNTVVVLETDYITRFVASLTFLHILDIEINWLLIC